MLEQHARAALGQLLGYLGNQTDTGLAGRSLAERAYGYWHLRPSLGGPGRGMLNIRIKLPYLTPVMMGIDLERADRGFADDLRIVPAGGVRGLSQLVLRTDIAGMPL